MEHVSYEKMPHSSAKWKFAGSSNEPDRVKWCVTEKCHGANFCIHCDGESTFYAKRKSLLSPDDPFFGYKSMVKGLEPKILNAFKTFTESPSMSKRYLHSNDQHTLSHISIYGELFGGFYPISPSKKNQENDDEEKEEKENEDSFVVQREILYSPNIHFYAFDVAITMRSEHRMRRQYIIYEDAISVLKAAEIFYAKPLFIGKYEECLHFETEFESLIPRWLGLPALSEEYGVNLAEGIVVKPMKNIYIECKGKQLKRPILKHKHRSFNERISSFNKEYGRFDASNSEQIHIQTLLNMINLNRFQSVISKHGRPSSNKQRKSKKDKKKKNKNNKNVSGDDDNAQFYAEAIVKDVYEDVLNDTDSAINAWWNTKVTTNGKLSKYIDNKMRHKALGIIPAMHQVIDSFFDFMSWITSLPFFSVLDKRSGSQTNTRI